MRIIDRYRFSIVMIFWAAFLIFSIYMVSPAAKINTRYYDSVEKTMDDEGRVILEEYLDKNGQKVKNPGGYYAIAREYDEQGRNYKVVYLDEEGNAVNNKTGYAILKRIFNEDGKVQSEYYYDLNESPVMLSNYNYGLSYGYDENGRIDLVTYIGSDGEPVTNKSGYSSVKRTFDEEGKLLTEMYYDINGEQVKLKRGQYGVLYDGNKTFYLGKDGRKIFEPMNFLNNYPVVVFLVGSLVIIISAFLSKRSNIIILVIYIVFTLYMTLGGRETVYERLKLTPFWSYVQFFTNQSLKVEILNNIWLFVPIGALGYSVKNSTKMIVSLCMISLLIELTQLITGLGMCEIDDLISNSLGAVIGWIICAEMRKKLNKT